MLATILIALAAGAYGLINAYAGWTQWHKGDIPRWSAGGMFVAGLFVVAAGYLVWQEDLFAVWVLLFGLLAIQLLTLENGMKLHGKINPTNQLLRLAISLTLLIPAWLVLG
jgi:hypothetical protein